MKNNKLKNAIFSLASVTINFAPKRRNAFIAHL